VTTTSLALYYDPTDTASYPGTGTTLTSLVGSGLNGTMTAVTYTSPFFTFNGTTSQVSVADNAALEPGSGSFSLEAWIRYSVIAGKTRTYISKTNNSSELKYLLAVINSKLLSFYHKSKFLDIEKILFQKKKHRYINTQSEYLVNIRI
jgi:hypothetical protein